MSNLNDESEVRQGDFYSEPYMWDYQIFYVEEVKTGSELPSPHSPPSSSWCVVTCYQDSTDHVYTTTMSTSYIKNAVDGGWIERLPRLSDTINNDKNLCICDKYNVIYFGCKCGGK